MRKWELICSIDSVDIDYRTVIESENEPDYWYCVSIAKSHGCEWWMIEEIESEER